MENSQGRLLISRMLFFLRAYSTSFFSVATAWPLVAVLLAMPLLAWEFGRLGRLSWPRAALLYLLALYVVGLFTFTLLPLPDDFAAYCAHRSRSIQLVPLGTVLDALGFDAGDVAQVVLNIVVFVPLGIFARALLGLSGRQALLLGLALSLLIEATQATALWGAAPCRHRVADVDDLLLNAFGAWLGVLLARPFALPPRPGR